MTNENKYGPPPSAFIMCVCLCVGGGGGGGYKHTFCKLFCFQGYEEVKRFGASDLLNFTVGFQ